MRRCHGRTAKFSGPRGPVRVLWTPVNLRELRIFRVSYTGSLWFVWPKDAMYAQTIRFPHMSCDSYSLQLGTYIPAIRLIHFIALILLNTG